MPQTPDPRPHVVVIGGLNMDLVVRVPVIPKPGETVDGGAFATFPGGKGANQAVAATRLGARVSMIGRVGGDAFGQQMLNAIRSEGIDASQVQVDSSQATGVALITVEDSGQNNISVASGANMLVSPGQVELALAALGRFDLLLMPLEVPMPAIIAAAKAAHRAGARLVLNPAPAKPLPAELLQAAGVLAPNEFEAAILTGAPVTDEASMQTAAQALARLAPQATILITLGERGAVYLAPSESQLAHVPPFKVQAVDTTAAGDAYVAGLSVALGEGKPFAEAARFAAAAGALAVTRAGAQPSLPQRAEVEALLAKSAG